MLLLSIDREIAGIGLIIIIWMITRLIIWRYLIEFILFLRIWWRLFLFFNWISWIIEQASKWEDILRKYFWLKNAKCLVLVNDNLEEDLRETEYFFLQQEDIFTQRKCFCEEAKQLHETLYAHPLVENSKSICVRYSLPLI